MLKIYRWTNKYELCDDKCVKRLSTLTGLCIKDESAAVDKTTEFGAYTREASRAYCKNAELKQKRKGIKAIYWTYDGAVDAKQWFAPNAKLIVHTSYEEDSCSMSRLMELDAPEVIAYLKQEGLNLSMPS
jgi:hypothetical protein